MSENDCAQVVDEIEVLTSIYGNQMHMHSDLNYTVDIDDGSEPPTYKLGFEVRVPESGYPSVTPVSYNCHAQWLRGENRKRLCQSLDRICRESIGECMVYKLILRQKEFLEELVADHDGSERDSPEPSTNDIEEYSADEGGYVRGATPPQESSVHNSAAVDVPVIYHGELIKDRKSVFQAHLARVTHKDQVPLVMDSLKENRKVAEATHNIIAYRIEGSREGVYWTGGVDDGETHASGRMLHLLDLMDARNVIVIVTRWYGGIHLGADRFKHINNCTRTILEEHGFVKDKTSDKKGPKSQVTAATQSTSAVANVSKRTKKLKM